MSFDPGGAAGTANIPTGLDVELLESYKNKVDHARSDTIEVIEGAHIPNGNSANEIYLLEFKIEELECKNRELARESEQWKCKCLNLEKKLSDDRVELETQREKEIEITQLYEELKLQVSNFEKKQLAGDDSRQSLELRCDKAEKELKSSISSKLNLQSKVSELQKTISERESQLAQFASISSLKDKIKEPLPAAVELKGNDNEDTGIDDSDSEKLQPATKVDSISTAEMDQLRSRVAYLESIVKMKTDSLAQLEGRMEELKSERDSYREAMMKVFEESHPDDHKRNGVTPSALDDTIKYAIGAIGSESLIGAAIGQLGVTTYLSGASQAGGGSLSLDYSTGKSSSVSSSTAGLQSQVAELTRQILELKHLEKNKDKIDELERRAAQAEHYTKEAQDYCAKEVDAVTSRLTHTQMKLSEAILEKEQMEVELMKTKKQLSKEAKKITFLTSEITELKSQLQYTKQLVKETEERLVDPIIVKNLEDKLNELNVERTHWQKKAQSLSKDMLRVLASVAEMDEMKAKMAVLQSRNEELQNERNMFREMMESAVQTVATPPPPSPGSSFFSGMNKLVKSPIAPASWR